ncbi:MAG: Gfo/Idh/MocA family protein, partial [Beijerinckiaceae bacterium]
YFAAFHRDAWRRIPEATVAALCDLDRERLAAAVADTPGAAGYTDAGEAIAAVRPDIVDIATGPSTHLALADMASRAGAFISCQKPIADTFRESAEVVELVESRGASMAVHENFRFMPWFIEAKRLLDAGALGQPLNVSFRLRPGDGQGPTAYLSRQPYFQTMPRLLIHETGVHFIDVFRSLLGEITGVFARLTRFNPAIKGEDAGYLVFDFANGARGMFDGNRLVDHPAENTRLTMGVMQLEGTGGTLRLDGFGRLFLKPHGGEEHEHAYAWSNRGFGGDCVYNQIRHIADHLTLGAPLQNSGRAYLRNLEIVEAAYASNAEGRFVRV